MTETTGVTVANFIAGILVVLVAITVIPSIVQNQVSSANTASLNSEFQYIVGSVNTTCGTTESQRISSSLPSDTSVIFKGNTVKLEGETVKQVKVKCSLNGGKVTKSGTFTLTLRGKGAGAGYEIV